MSGYFLISLAPKQPGKFRLTRPDFLQAMLSLYHLGSLARFRVCSVSSKGEFVNGGVGPQGSGNTVNDE
jgi:hypothetical protein